MSDRDLIAIGFTEHDGVLVAPENSRVRLEPAGAAFYRLYVSIGNRGDSGIEQIRNQAHAREAMSDDDLADRQFEAHIRCLYVLRELNLVDAPSTSLVVAALTATMLLRVPPEHRRQVRRQLDSQVAHFLSGPIADVIPDHDA
jgi:hypothetical protein